MGNYAHKGRESPSKLLKGDKMDNPTKGPNQPDLSIVGEQGANEAKTRTYKTPNGGSIEITEEEFQSVVAIFDFLRQSRDEKIAQLDIELAGSSSQTITNPLLLKKAG